MALINLPYVFSVGQIIVASQHNSNFSTIYNDYNGNITYANLAANSAIPYSNLSLSNSIRNSDILSTTVFNAANIPNIQLPYVKVSERQSSGTGAGNPSIGSFIARVLNTIDTDTASIASLGSNQVTLPAGTYITSVVAPFYGTELVQLRLYNVTSSTVLLTGQSSYMALNGGAPVYLSGLFTLSVSSAIAVQYQVQNSASSGLGQACSFGQEVYTIAEFTKVA